MDLKLHQKEYFAQENGKVRRQGLLLRIAERRKRSQTANLSSLQSVRIFPLPGSEQNPGPPQDL
jgi:hypothetical protein